MTTLSDTFEALRRLAEADTADAGTDQRRPSWAPALVLGGDILSVLGELGRERPDKPVARLWATFAGRGKLDMLLRSGTSTLPMPGVRVRAFELRLGVERSGTRLLRATRGESGWYIDMAYRQPPRLDDEWRAKVALRQAQKDVDHYRERAAAAPPGQSGHALYLLQYHEARLPPLQQSCAELKADCDQYRQRQDRLGELIKRRVAEFAGDPYAQMIAGARVTGNCGMCGRGLTDPLSLERGIGPECFGKIAPQLRAHLVERQGKAA